MGRTSQSRVEFFYTPPSALLSKRCLRFFIRIRPSKPKAVVSVFSRLGWFLSPPLLRPFFCATFQYPLPHRQDPSYFPPLSGLILPLGPDCVPFSAFSFRLPLPRRLFFREYSTSFQLLPGTLWASQYADCGTANRPRTTSITPPINIKSPRAVPLETEM